MDYCLVLFLLFTVSVDGSLFKKNVVKIYDFQGICEGHETAGIKIINITTRTDKSRRTLIDGSLIVEKDLLESYKQEITITKCNSIESLDSCLTFQTIQFPDVCLIHKAKNQVWSSFFENITPRLLCPMKKSTLVMKNAYFDGERLPFPFDPNYYWKVHIVDKDTKTDKIEFCMEFLCQIIALKN